MQQPLVKPIPSWRASQLPSYQGPDVPDDFHANGTTPAPFEGHRWLPVRSPPGKYFDISQSPAGTLTFHPHGPGWTNWAASAQTHYSFLQHLEDGDTGRYHFDIWDYNYERLSINFLAIRGRDIAANFPFPHDDDEWWLTVGHPKELGQHVIVAGEGIAAHFSFGPQRDAHDSRGLAWTDVLGRYLLYAQENVCPFPRRAVSRPVP